VYTVCLWEELELPPCPIPETPLERKGLVLDGRPALTLIFSLFRLCGMQALRGPALKSRPCTSLVLSKAIYTAPSADKVFNTNEVCNTNQILDKEHSLSTIRLRDHSQGRHDNAFFASSKVVVAVSPGKRRTDKAVPANRPMTAVILV
jgi:hypothetical protein